MDKVNFPYRSDSHLPFLHVVLIVIVSGFGYLIFFLFLVRSFSESFCARCQSGGSSFVCFSSFLTCIESVD